MQIIESMAVVTTAKANHQRDGSANHRNVTSLMGADIATLATIDYALRMQCRVLIEKATSAPDKLCTSHYQDLVLLRDVNTAHMVVQTAIELWTVPVDPDSAPLNGRA